jgi:hypothetical protein
VKDIIYYTVRVDLVQLLPSGVERVISRHEGLDHQSSGDADEVYRDTVHALKLADDRADTEDDDL